MWILTSIARVQNIDVLTLALLGLQVVLFFALPLSTSRYFFLVYFAVWRLAYNCGLGYVLRKQSETKWIVKTVLKQGWMDSKRRPAVRNWIASELKAKMGKDYEFDVSARSRLERLSAEVDLCLLVTVGSARVQCG